MEPAHSSGLSSGRPRPTISIIAVAVFQVVASILTLLMFERILLISYFSDQATVPAGIPLGLAILLAAGLSELIAAIGLLLLKNWARLLSLGLATALLCGCAITAILRRPHPPWDWTALFLELALWALIPVSMWWWIVFTRKRVRAQFH